MTSSLYLPILLLLPLAGAVVVAGMSGAPGKTVKLTALGFSIVELGVAIALWVAYRSSMDANPSIEAAAAPFKQVFSVEWIPSFGVSFSWASTHLADDDRVDRRAGADRARRSWEEKLPPAGPSRLLRAAAGVAGGDDRRLRGHRRVRVLRDVRGHADPMYFLIGVFGGVRRAYAATKFFLYSLLGGLLMLPR